MASNDYEAARLENIKRNKALLASLDIATISGKPARPPPAKKRKIDSTASRISARIASGPLRTYNERALARTVPRTVSLPRDPRRRPQSARRNPTRARSARRGEGTYLEDSSDDFIGDQRDREVRDREPRRSSGRKVKRDWQVKEEESSDELSGDQDQDASVSHPSVQIIVAGWTAWKPSTAPPRRNPATNAFEFDDYPDFRPNKSPAEVLREGAFGGGYYRPITSQSLGVEVSGDWRDDLPGDWVEGLAADAFLTQEVYDADINKFKVRCGQTIEEWEAAGWIAYEFDVRGWFQWFVRFFRGRRCGDDERQVSRWRKCVGKTGRWRRMLLKKYGALGVRTVWDDGEDEDQVQVSPVMHQTYEVRQDTLDEYWAS